MDIKRTQREDEAARITRTIRDQMYRRCGYDRTSSEYRAVVETLARVRDELRK